MMSTAVAACEITSVNYQSVADKAIIVLDVKLAVFPDNDNFNEGCYLFKSFDFALLSYYPIPELSHSVAI